MPIRTSENGRYPVPVRTVFRASGTSVRPADESSEPAGTSGGAGGSATDGRLGITGSDGALNSEAPKLVRVETAKVYRVPLASPVSRHVVAPVVSQTAQPGSATTQYPVISPVPE